MVILPLQGHSVAICLHLLIISDPVNNVGKNIPRSYLIYKLTAIKNILDNIAR